MNEYDVTWHEDKLVGRYSLESDNKIMCVFHPKPTNEYVKYLGITAFGNEKSFNQWFEEINFWYGNIAPKELSNKEVVTRLMQMIYGIYI